MLTRAHGCFHYMYMPCSIVIHEESSCLILSSAGMQAYATLPAGTCSSSSDFPSISGALKAGMVSLRAGAVYICCAALAFVSFVGILHVPVVQPSTATCALPSVCYC